MAFQSRYSSFQGSFDNPKVKNKLERTAVQQTAPSDSISVYPASHFDGMEDNRNVNTTLASAHATSSNPTTPVCWIVPPTPLSPKPNEMDDEYLRLAYQDELRHEEYAVEGHVDDVSCEKQVQELLLLSANLFKLTNQVYKLIDEKFELTQPPTSTQGNHLNRLEYLGKIAQEAVVYGANRLELSQNLRIIHQEQESDPDFVLELAQQRCKLIMDRFALVMNRRTFAETRVVPDTHRLRVDENEAAIAEANINLFLCIEAPLRQNAWIEGSLKKAVAESLFNTSSTQDFGHGQARNIDILFSPLAALSHSPKSGRE